MKHFLFFRRRPARPVTYTHATLPGDPTIKPGYPERYYPADHQLPSHIPAEADFLLWIEQRVEDLARQGALDAGTPFVLDLEIDAMRTQWSALVDHQAKTQRTRAGEAILKDQLAELETDRHHLAHSRHQVHDLTTETTHHRAILNGHPATPLPATSGTTASTSGVSGMSETGSRPTPASLTHDLTIALPPAPNCSPSLYTPDQPDQPLHLLNGTPGAAPADEQRAG